MRVSDLIPSRAFLVTRNYRNLQNHLVLLRRETPSEASFAMYPPIHAWRCRENQRQIR